MMISLDYDNTFTRDEEFWCQVVALGRLRGHQFVCVTGRRQPPDPQREVLIPMPVVCAPEQWKDAAARRAGYEVDVWIDDMPHIIRPEGILDFGSEPRDADLAHVRKLLGDVPVSRNALMEVWKFVKEQP